MREIKFRAWNRVKKEMEYDIQFDTHIGTIKEHPDKTFGRYIIDLNYAIMQCTGFKDKNDVEIYEGDIVKIKNTFYYDGKYEVIYSNHRLAFVLKSIEKINYITFDNIGVDYDVDLGIHIEVIGNIYETKVGD